METYVDSVADWLLLLETLERYFELEGLDHLRLMVLNLLTRLKESRSPVNYVSTLTLLGIQYSRLGYASHAGRVLQTGMCNNSETTLSRLKADMKDARERWSPSKYLQTLGSLNVCTSALKAI